MNNKKVTGISLVVALVVALGFSFIGGDVQVDKVVERVIERQVGAIPGTSVQGPAFSVNGNSVYQYNASFRNFSTTTPCSFGGLTASSTIIDAGLFLKENSGGTQGFIGFGAANATADRFSTSTVIASFNGNSAQGAGTSFFLKASSTNTEVGGSLNWVLPPNRYLNFSITANTTATGTCYAILQELQ
jgi:hypothetical protein